MAGITVRDRLAGRMFIGPVVRHFFPSELIKLGPDHVYVIRHPRFAMYSRDPFNMKDNYSDPRAQWGTLKQAHRFGSYKSAESCVMWQEIDGIIEQIPFR